MIVTNIYAKYTGFTFHRKYHVFAYWSSLFSKLEAFLSANPSHRSLPFFCRTDSMDSPGLFADTSEHIRLFNFFVSRLLVFGSMR